MTTATPTSPTDQLDWIFECATFVIMLGVSVIIGLYYGFVEGKQNTVSEYLLGSKHMSVFSISMSLIASHVSGISLLGTPSEVYTNGSQYLIVAGINVVVILIVVNIFLPVFYELQLTSVYEYLELRFDSNIRVLGSLIFAVSIILFIPVVIFVPALAFSQVTGLNVHFATPFICVVCIFYTTVGGLKAVVMTDTIQSVFTTGAMVIVFVLGYVQVGGFSNVIKANRDGGRIEFFRMDPDPFLRNTFWTVSIGTTFQWVSLMGIAPGCVQRFVALPTYKKARDSLIYFLIGIGVTKILTGAIGMIIYTKYKDCDPTSANYIKSDKNLLPYYVVDVAAKYPGITGLFVSGIVSAALSTMSAQLNTVSGTIYEDLIVKAMGLRVSDLTASVIMKCTVVVTGIMCVALVAVVERLNGILQMSISMTSVVNGALLSVFTLGVCFPRANSRGAMCGMLASIGATAWIIYGAQSAIYNRELKFVEKSVSIAGCPPGMHFRNRTDFSKLYRINEDVYASPNVWKIFTVSYMYYNAIGTVVGIAVGLAVSLLFATEQTVDPKLLTPCIRRVVYPNYVAADNANETITEEYVAVPLHDTRL